MYRLLTVGIIIISVLLLSSSCTGKKQSGSKPDFLNRPVTIAGRFTIEYTDSCTIIYILNPWQGANGIKQSYYLVKHGKKLPLIADTSKIIYIPVRKIVCTSSTHLAMISALGEADAIAGYSGVNFIFDTHLAERAAAGLIGEIGYDSGINTELIIKLKPDLMLMYGIGSESAGYIGKLREMGIKVMLDADYLETDPLGKLEWLKLFGALFCKEKMADSVFRSICESYNTLKTYINTNINNRPDVMLGLPFRDSWFVSPGNSYISTLINDAGGNYIWRETRSSASVPYSVESVYLQSLNAEYWLNIGSVSSKDEILQYDSRFGMIPSFKNSNLFNNNKRMNLNGGNDYWESGTLNPDVILKDIASILHPGLFSSYELFYYRKIE